jgi:hypothetical protein
VRSLVDFDPEKVVIFIKYFCIPLGFPYRLHKCTDINVLYVLTFIFLRCRLIQNYSEYFHICHLNNDTI